ncbi:MAG: CDP-diacylglycerol--glycerol-3-phosphate 3-phosphatidyltransferase [Deltaproteobacteria bacterium]
MGKLRRDILNAPNAITVVRIAMIPVILAFTYYEGRVNSFIAGVLFAITGATDFLDGWMARRTNTVTVVGKFLDPLADKLIVMSILIMLVHLGRVPAWLVILILAREFIVTGLRTMAMGEGIVIAAGQEGKYKTSIQLAAISFLLIHYKYRVDFLAFEVDVDANVVGTWLLYLSVAFSLWSAWVYMRDFFKGVYAPEPGAPGGPHGS